MEESSDRPPMDLFKAIFENSASSSSEASDDDEDRQQMDAESRTATTDNVKADTVPYVTAAAVPEAALMTVQQQDYKGRAYLTPYRSVGGLLFSLPETTEHVGGYTAEFVTHGLSPSAMPDLWLPSYFPVSQKTSTFLLLNNSVKN